MEPPQLLGLIHSSIFFSTLVSADIERSRNGLAIRMETELGVTAIVATKGDYRQRSTAMTRTTTLSLFVLLRSKLTTYRSLG